jgi:hypothetical protein
MFVSAARVAFFASAAFVSVNVFGFATAQADVIAYFNFDAANPALITPQSSSDAPADGASLSTLAIAPGYVRGGYDNNQNTSTTALSYYNGQQFTTLPAAEAINDALQITVTPGSTPLTLTSLELDSYDYANSGVCYVVDSVNGPSSPDGMTTNGARPGTATTISLPSDLANLTSPVTFDFYSVGVYGYVDKGIHSLEIDGVAGVPEPASVGLLAVAALGALTRPGSRSSRSA